MPSRRGFLRSAGALALAGAVRPAGAAQQQPVVGPAVPLPPLRKPPRLRKGDVVGLAAPASATFLSEDLEIAQEVARALGLEPRLGTHVRDRHGYLAGRDEDRAADLDTFFADPKVRGVLAIRGGWGCARTLPHLDWDVIRRNPKVLAGYSDITALHCGIQAKAGFVTFHAPTALDTWPAFSVEHFRRIVFEGEAVRMANEPLAEGRLVPRDGRTRTISAGLARGRLLGGNLTVLTALLGSAYVPSFDGAILFLEDVHEDIYRVDRMLTQLALAGVLGRVRGLVFGSCSKCGPGEGYASLTLEEVLDDHVRPLGVPAYDGALFGHQERQFTLPVGAEVELDAAAGTIAMLEPAVA